MASTRKLVTRLLLLVLMVWSLPSIALAQAQTPSVLEELLSIMRRRGDITEEQQKQLLEKAKKEEASRIQAGIERGKPYLRSADGNFRVELSGNVQADYVAVEPNMRALTGGTINDRFFIRRAEFEVAALFYQWAALKLAGDFADTPTVVLKDAYLSFALLGREVAFRIGQFAVPFTREEPVTSAKFLDFIERSLVNELAPAKDFGAMLYGDLFDQMVSYNLGVFNGAGEDTADANREKVLAGRLTVVPFKQTNNVFLKGLEVAGNFTWGDEDAPSTSATGRTMGRTGTRFTAFTAHGTLGQRTRWGGDLTWLVGPASLKFEYARRADERKKQGVGGADLSDIVATAWFVSGTFVLTGEQKLSSGNVVPMRPFSPIAGQMGPGAWELGLRYAQLTFDSNSPLDFFDGSVANGISVGGTTAENEISALTAGVNWYLNSNTRAMLNWTQYWYDNPLGTPFSCRLATCTATQLVPGSKESWELLSRVQVWF
jgi:phosphate-selective porin OprO/OprP